MQAFIVEARNRPGELARITESIAKQGINIEAFCIGYDGTGLGTFLSHDENGLKRTLSSEGITYKEVPFLTVWLENRPGTVANCAKRLADAGVNIQFLAPVDHTPDQRTTFAIGVDKVDVAKTALSDQLAQWKVPEPVMVGATR